MQLAKLFSSYKQKLEISPSLVGKWPSKNKGTRDASVDRSNEAENWQKILKSRS